MKISNKDLNEKYVNIWTTKKVKELTEKEDKGIKLKLNEKIWFDNKVGVRKANIKFAMTKKELEEYTKCKLDIQYFANNYCHIKREDGTIGPMQLRDYQRDIIDLFQNNRSILMASRQTGKCSSPLTEIIIVNANGDEVYVPFFEIYYDEIRKTRRLTLLETIKLYLFRLYKKIDK
jgi:hypothetical protein